VLGGRLPHDKGPGGVLDTIGVGHQWPSGAAQDRRAWAEVIAYDADGGVIYSSGVVPDGTPVTSIDDADLWLLRDCMFEAQSKAVVNFWEAATTSGYELPAMATFDPSQMSYYASHAVQTFPRNGALQLKRRPARVTLRMRIQPGPPPSRRARLDARLQRRNVDAGLAPGELRRDHRIQASHRRHGRLGGHLQAAGELTPRVSASPSARNRQ
jgi:hypothetical protein